MKDNIICTNIRFNLDNPLHQKAWEYLQTMDKSQFKSWLAQLELTGDEFETARYHLLKNLDGTGIVRIAA